MCHWWSYIWFGRRECLFWFQRSYLKRWKQWHLKCRGQRYSFWDWPSFLIQSPPSHWIVSPQLQTNKSFKTTLFLNNVLSLEILPVIIICRCHWWGYIWYGRRECLIGFQRSFRRWRRRRCLSCRGCRRGSRRLRNYRVGFKEWTPYSIRITAFYEFYHTLWDIISPNKHIVVNIRR